MIISRTPFRVSLFGGGTDYPSYFNEHQGCALGFAIDRYCYLTVRKLPPFFNHRHRIVYSKIELVNSVDEIQHPTAKAVLSEYRELIGSDGLEIHHDGDLPARAGLGSSSSFVVGLLNSLNALYGKRLTIERLRDEAIRIERDVAGETVGSQDQSFAAEGGLLFLEFERDDVSSIKMALSPNYLKEILSHFLLLFTGTTRFASVIAEAQVLRAEQNLETLHHMARIARSAYWAIADHQPIEDIGHRLHETWMLKRSLSSLISTPAIDMVYNTARVAGALGGKLLGAGGGGFMLLFVPPERRQGVVTALQSLIPGFIEVPLRIAQRGSEIVLNEPNGF